MQLNDKSKTLINVANVCSCWIAESSIGEHRSKDFCIHFNGFTQVFRYDKSEDRDADFKRIEAAILRNSY